MSSILTKSGAYGQSTTTVEVYVAARDCDGVGIRDYAGWVRQVEQAVCALTGGGCTTYEAVGTWDGRKESVTIVRGALSGCPGLRALRGGSGPDRAIDELLGPVLRDYATKTNQEAAGLTVNGEWYCVRPEPTPPTLRSGAGAGQ